MGAIWARSCGRISVFGWSRYGHGGGTNVVAPAAGSAGCWPPGTLGLDASPRAPVWLPCPAVEAVVAAPGLPAPLRSVCPVACARVDVAVGDAGMAGGAPGGHGGAGAPPRGGGLARALAPADAAAPDDRAWHHHLGDKAGREERGAAMSKTGVVLGRFQGRTLRFDGPENVLLVGPARSGKGVGVLIPSILELGQEHLIIIDIRGETWDATAGYRNTLSRCLRLSLMG